MCSANYCLTPDRTLPLPAGRPAPTITWFVNDRMVDGFVERPEENVLVSRLQEHAMMRRHLNNTYRCQASNTKLRDPTQRSVRLEMIREYFQLLAAAYSC